MDCGERYTGNWLGYGKKIRTEWIFSKEVKAASLAIIFPQLGKNNCLVRKKFFPNWEKTDGLYSHPVIMWWKPQCNNSETWCFTILFCISILKPYVKAWKQFGKNKIKWWVKPQFATFRQQAMFHPPWVSISSTQVSLASRASVEREPYKCCSGAIQVFYTSLFPLIRTPSDCS